MRALIFEHCSSKYARKFYEAVDGQSFHLTSYRTSWEKKYVGKQWLRPGREGRC